MDSKEMRIQTCPLFGVMVRQAEHGDAQDGKVKGAEGDGSVRTAPEQCRAQRKEHKISPSDISEIAFSSRPI